MTTEAQYAGALVLQPDLYWRDQVPPEDIENPTARAIVATVADMLRDGAEVDVVSVSERAGLPLQLVGGITQEVYSPVGAASAARVIREAAVRRRALGWLADATEEVREGGDPVGVVSGLHDRVTQRDDSQALTMADALAEYDARGDKARRMVTQIPKLNELLPIDGGKLVVIAGRPGTFKSAFALHVARYTAVRGAGVGIVSLEMPAWEIADRWLKLGGGDRADVPIYLNCTAQDLGAIETQIIQWAQRDGVSGAVVDYLGLIGCPATRQMRRDEVIGVITRRLKLLAMRLDIPILLVAQLNRESEKHGRRPILSDLRESGNVEQDADVVIFLHRREIDGHEEYELLLAKHRGGPTGFIDLHVDKARYRVLEAER